MINPKKLLIFILLLSFTTISIGVSFLPAEAETVVNTLNDENDVYLPLVGLAPWINPFGYESNVPVAGTIYEQRVDELGGSWARINRQISWRELQPNEGDAINWSLLTGFEEELRIEIR